MELLERLILQEGPNSLAALEYFLVLPQERIKEARERLLQACVGAHYRAALLRSLIDRGGGEELSSAEKQILERVLEDGQLNEIIAACEVIAHYPDASFVPAVMGWLDVKNPPALRAAIEALDASLEGLPAEDWEPFVNTLIDIRELRGERSKNQDLLVAKERMLGLLLRLAAIGVRPPRDDRGQLLGVLFSILKTPMAETGLVNKALTLLLALSEQEPGEVAKWQHWQSCVVTALVGHFSKEQRPYLIHLIRKCSQPDFEPILCMVAQRAMGAGDIHKIEDFAGLLRTRNDGEEALLISELLSSASGLPLTTLDVRLKIDEIQIMSQEYLERVEDPADEWLRGKAAMEIRERLASAEWRTRREFEAVFEILMALSGTVLGTLFFARGVVEAELTRERERQRAGAERERASDSEARRNDQGAGVGATMSSGSKTPLATTAAGAVGVAAIAEASSNLDIDWEFWGRTGVEAIPKLNDLNVFLGGTDYVEEAGEVFVSAVEGAADLFWEVLAAFF